MATEWKLVNEDYNGCCAYHEFLIIYLLLRC